MVQSVLDVVAYIGAIIGALFVGVAIFGDASAPQQAALAGVGIGVAAIPYFISAIEHRAEMRRRGQ